MAHEFKSVTLEAEHRPETHRTLENDHTVTSVELPGQVYLYANFDGGRVLLDTIKAPVVFEAIERGKQSAAQSADEQTTAQAGEQSGYQPEGNRPNGEQTQPQG